MKIACSPILLTILWIHYIFSMQYSNIVLYTDHILLLINTIIKIACSLHEWGKSPKWRIGGLRVGGLDFMGWGLKKLRGGRRFSVQDHWESISSFNSTILRNVFAWSAQLLEIMQMHSSSKKIAYSLTLNRCHFNTH